MMTRNSAACIAHAFCLVVIQQIVQVPTLPFFFFCLNKNTIFFLKNRITDFSHIIQLEKKKYNCRNGKTNMRKEEKRSCSFLSSLYIHTGFKRKGKYTHKEITYWRTEIDENISKQWPMLSGALYTWMKSLLYLYLWLFHFFFPTSQ